MLRLKSPLKLFNCWTPFFAFAQLENMVVTAWAVNIWLKLNYHLLLTFWSLMLNQICTLYWICTDMHTQKFSHGSFEGKQSLGMDGLMDIFLYFNFFAKKGTRLEALWIFYHTVKKSLCTTQPLLYVPYYLTRSEYLKKTRKIYRSCIFRMKKKTFLSNP